MLFDKAHVGVWVVDVQERLFPHIDRSCEILERICFMIEAANLLKMPIFITEQVPEKMGETVQPIKERLPEGQLIYPKTTFSGMQDQVVKKAIEKLGVETWILVGIETHICVLQTAKDLLSAKKQVIVLNDAVSSRSLFDFSTAIGELRDIRARISSTETIVYECIQDANTEIFKSLLPIIKKYA